MIWRSVSCPTDPTDLTDPTDDYLTQAYASEQ